MNALSPNVVVNVIGETCPIPLVEMRKAVLKAQKGDVIEIQGTHPASKKEIPMAVHSLGLELISISEEASGVWHIVIRK